METKPSEQTDVTQSASQQDTEQPSQPSTSVCVFTCVCICDLCVPK